MYGTAIGHNIEEDGGYGEYVWRLQKHALHINMFLFCKHVYMCTYMYVCTYMHISMYMYPCVRKYVCMCVIYMLP